MRFIVVGNKDIFHYSIELERKEILSCSYNVFLSIPAFNVRCGTLYCCKSLSCYNTIPTPLVIEFLDKFKEDFLSKYPNINASKKKTLDHLLKFIANYYCLYNGDFLGYHSKLSQAREYLGNIIYMFNIQ